MVNVTDPLARAVLGTDPRGKRFMTHDIGKKNALVWMLSPYSFTISFKSHFGHGFFKLSKVHIWVQGWLQDPSSFICHAYPFDAMAFVDAFSPSLLENSFLSGCFSHSWFSPFFTMNFKILF
jgi:hypothetical protein